MFPETSRSLLWLAALAAAGLGVAVLARSGRAQGRGAPPAVAESLAEGVVRYWASAGDPASAPPSVALAGPARALGPASPGARLEPRFAVEQGGRVARLATESGTSLYGTGMVAGPLLRNGRSVTLWNTDAYGYDERSPSLYQSHPWVLGVRADGSAFGVLADTPGRVTIDLGRGIEIRHQGPAFAVIVIEGAGPQEVLRSLAGLIGTLPLPPLWSLGFHQCRYSYYPDSQVVGVAEEYRRRRLPCDVVWLDIDYMDGYRCFTWSPAGFPDPQALDRRLAGLGFRTVAILDPGIKRDPDDPVYIEGTHGDHWVKTRAGEDAVGRVWPGECVFPDFTREATRAWWAKRVGELVETGIDGLWNDMNEPALFGVDSKTLPEDSRHRADPELGGPGPHLRYHNVYGMLMSRASHEGLLRARPERRPFVLTRAGHLGGQRYAACWTGDNRATWEHLQVSVPMSLNLGLSGQPFSGPDIGGFGGAPGPRLFARWMGVGTLFPFARAHSEKGSPRREPWSFGPGVEATCRRALETRYRLLPYLYTLFREASVSGLPVMRPVFFADPKDARLRAEDEAFLLGADLLVVPDLRLEGPRAKALPAGRWREAAIAPRAAGEPVDPDLPRLWVRGGAILPLGPVVQHTGERPLDEVELLVSLDGEGRAEGALYEDAGDGFGYRRGEYRLSRFRAEASGGRLEVRLASSEGSWGPPAGRRYRVTLLRAADEPGGTFREVKGP